MRKLAALKSWGYEVAKGQYLWWRMMTKLDAIEIESTHVIEIDLTDRAEDIAEKLMDMEDSNSRECRTYLCRTY